MNMISMILNQGLSTRSFFFNEGIKHHINDNGKEVVNIIDPNWILAKPLINL
jgi:hypothetical protein